MPTGTAHFIGLCGAGMSAVARILQEAGWTVTGSDEGFYPPISTIIERYQIPCAIGYRPENIPSDADWIVIGRHARLVPEENAEVAAALSSGKRVLSFPEVLREIAPEKTRLVVAGSFGKSSCTALATHLLMHAEKDPAYFIGAEALNLSDNGHCGTGDLFVLEGDEYPASNWDDRSKFLFYQASAVLLTSGEHDHVNVFPTLDDYLAPFQELVGGMASDGLIVACRTGAHLERVVDGAPARVVWYGLDTDDVDWTATDLRAEGGTTVFTLSHHGEAIVTLRTILLGRHNIENIVGVAALLLERGALTSDEIAAGIASFRGVRRRLERLTSEGTVPVYNDFGSSQAKCRAGITTIQSHFPTKKLRVCFEPHTFSFRNRDALHWYDTLFSGVARVYLFQPPSHGAATHSQLTQEEIAARIAASGVSVTQVSSADQLLERLAVDIDRADDVLLFETSGGFDGAIPRVAALFSDTP